jgi:hypothetical protein
VEGIAVDNHTIHVKKKRNHDRDFLDLKINRINND